MRRGEFITLASGAGIAWPLAGRAQQPGMPIVGFLDSGGSEYDRVAAFRQGLKEAGYVEGQNVAVDFRWAEGRYDGLPGLAAELIRRQPAAIFAATIQAALAVKAATTSIPIVFAIGSDPVEQGLVASLNRPGGNITGTSWLGGATLAPKRLEVLHEAVPSVPVVAALVNPTNPIAEGEAINLKETARALGLQLHILNVSTGRQIEEAFAALIQLGTGAVSIGADNFLFGRRGQLIVRTARHALPAISQWREFAAAGSLMSYGTNVSEAWRHAAVYVGRVLTSQPPSLLPVQQAVKVELVINLNTANAIGVTFPPTLLARADEVIE